MLASLVVIGSVSLLLLLILLSLFINILIHELGHAIPILFMAKGDVRVFIGSFGDSGQSIRWKIGRIEIFIKYNPLTWTRGLCKPPSGVYSVNQQILYIATGPIASVLVTAVSWYLMKEVDFAGFYKLAIFFVFFFSLTSIVGLIYERKKSRFNNSGRMLGSDAAQIRRLLKWKRMSPDYLKAWEYCAGKKFHEAAIILDEMIESGYKNVEVYRLSVMANLNSNNYERGQYVNEMIQREYHFVSEDFVQEGYIRNKTHRNEDAILSYQKALDLTPDNIYALHNLGYSLAVLDKNEEALPYFEKVISVSPQMSHAHTNRGWVKMKMGSLEDGLKDVNYSLQLDPTIPDSYRNLGFYYMEKGEFAKAIELFQKAKGMDENIPLIDEYMAEAISRRKIAKGVN